MVKNERDQSSKSTRVPSINPFIRQNAISDRRVDEGTFIKSQYESSSA
jgi:hypothetical protein